MLYLLSFCHHSLPFKIVFLGVWNRVSNTLKIYIMLWCRLYIFILSLIPSLFLNLSIAHLSIFYGFLWLPHITYLTILVSFSSPPVLHLFVVVPVLNPQEVQCVQPVLPPIKCTFALTHFAGFSTYLLAGEAHSSGKGNVTSSEFLPSVHFCLSITLILEARTQKALASIFFLWVSCKCCSTVALLGMLVRNLMPA